MKTLCVALAATLLTTTATATAGEPEGLWITDDVEKKVYHVTLSGSLISSFDEVDGANSGIAVSRVPDDGSLWGIDESPSQAVRFSTTGSIISSFDGSKFGASALEGIGTDPDGSLWIINDPKGGDDPSVFNTDQSGNLIDSFPTSSYDSSSISPQSICIDPDDGTLWIADNSSDMVYNVSRTGSLIDEFSNDEFDSSAGNMQGISIDENDDTLWLTARDTGDVYNITKSGSLITSFSSSTFDSSSDDPTGVAYYPIGGGDPPVVLSGTFALDGLQPDPPTASTAVGAATCTLDLGSNLFTWDVSWAGTEGADDPHFHGPAGVGNSAPVTIAIGPGNPATGSQVLSSSDAQDVQDGLWYVDVHTPGFARGEIRGQVLFDWPDWSDEGGATSGINGPPSLAGGGPLTSGSLTTLTLLGAAPGAAMLAWLSFTSVPFPFFGGTIHANPPTSQHGFVSDAGGSFQVSATWPGGVSSGTEVWFQFLIQDFSTVPNLALSNAVKATAP